MLRRLVSNLTSNSQELVELVESVGDEIPDMVAGKMRFYIATGSIADAWLEIFPHVNLVLQELMEDIEGHERKPCSLGVGIYMVGVEPSRARPIILISSSNERQRKKAKRKIKGLSIMSNYPVLRIETDGQRPAEFRGADLDCDDWIQQNPDYKITIIGEPENLCGASINCGPLAKATLGGVIHAYNGDRSKAFGLTAYHPGSRTYIEQAENQETPREIAFDNDSDDEDEVDSEDQDDELVLSTSQASHSSGSDHMDSSTNSSTRAKHETFDETIIFNPVDKMNSAGTIDVPESGLDYQIFPIPDEFGEASYGTIQITEANVSITLRPRSVMKLAKNKDIWVATVNGVVKGRLSSCPYILKMPGWASYQEVWVVNLERNILPGDCGAWVVDRDEQLCGHIIASRSTGSQGFILPAYKIFADIKNKSNCQVSLRPPQLLVPTYPMESQLATQKAESLMVPSSSSRSHKQASVLDLEPTGLKKPDFELAQQPWSLNFHSVSSTLKSWSSSSTSTAVGSIISDSSWRPKNSFRRFTLSSPPNQWSEFWLTPTPIGRKEFITYIIGDMEPSYGCPDSAFWFTKYLEYKMDEFWSLYRRNMTRVDDISLIPSEDDTTTAFRMLIVLMKLISPDEDLALISITDHLINDGFLKDFETEEERELQILFVFTLIGWITMLYESQIFQELYPRGLKLKTQSLYLGNQIALHSQTIIETSQPFECVEQPLHVMLGRFGDLIPHPIQRTPYESVINALHVNYYSLRKSFNIVIEWVDTINMHLEFDPARKVLKLFRFPSFCLLMYRDKKERSLLHQLFTDSARDKLGDVSNIPSGFFFAELLLTYRLIFGQDTPSWKLFQKEMAQLGNSRTMSFLKDPISDPLLPILCGQSHDTSQAKEVYDYIHAVSVMPLYSAECFPFFIRKILAIQRFAETQKPVGWTSLWHDSKRSKSNWWEFWA